MQKIQRRIEMLNGEKLKDLIMILQLLKIRSLLLVVNVVIAYLINLQQFVRVLKLNGY